jgi:phosphohistidine phosphatase
MKNLYLIRHAKAVSQELGVNDFKRALSKQGRNDAVAMSKRLCERDIAPDLLISSPADRALETAHIFAEQFDYPVQRILLQDEIYDEDADVILEILKTLDDIHSSVMLFGHEPTLSQLAGFLLPGEERELRTTGVFGISLDIRGWQELAAKSGTLQLFDFPVRATPKAYKKARNVIAKEISGRMEDVLKHFDAESSKHVQKVLAKTNKKLAKALTKVLKASTIEDLAGGRSEERIDHLGKAAGENISAPLSSDFSAKPAKTTHPEGLSESSEGAPTKDGKGAGQPAKRRTRKKKEQQ